jgi:hypothetical protein
MTLVTKTMMNNEYISTNNSLQNSPINHYDQESPTIIDNNNPCDNNSDSDDDSSIYTHVDNNSDSYNDSSIHTNAHTMRTAISGWIGKEAMNPSILEMLLNIMTQLVYLATKDGYVMQQSRQSILLVVLTCLLS